MAKYKPCNDKQMVMLPISLEDQILPGSLEHTISRLVEEHVALPVFEARASPQRTAMKQFTLHTKCKVDVQ